MGSTAELDVRRERAAKNQSLFREVNERIEDLSSSSAFTAYVCECLDTECEQAVSMTGEEYEHVRSDGNRFFVLCGHQLGDLEEIVETADRFLVVEKLGRGRRVAMRLDPRNRLKSAPRRSRRS